MRPTQRWRQCKLAPSSDNLATRIRENSDSAMANSKPHGSSGEIPRDRCLTRDRCCCTCGGALPQHAPHVDVLLPAWNAARTLPRALGSLLRQRHRNWTCLLIDDGSTDETWAIAQRFSARDARIRPLRQEHSGLVRALNWGLSHCRAEFVARFDADDVMHSERLALQLELLQTSPQLCAVGCHVRIFPTATLTLGRQSYVQWLNSLCSPEAIFRDRFVECPLAHPTWCMRRGTLQEFGYRHCSWPEDYDLILRLLAAGEHLGTVPRSLLGWRDHPTRASRTDQRYSLEQFTTCKAHYLARDWLHGSGSYVLWGYGDTGRQLCRALAEQGKHPSHIVELHPGRLGQRIQGAPVIPPSTLQTLDWATRRMVVSVSGQGPRSDVRAFALTLGLSEGSHYVCAA